MKKMNVCFGKSVHVARCVVWLLACAAVLPVAADVFKWTDEHGNVQYSDQPPAATSKIQTVRIQKSGATVVADKPETPPKPAADTEKSAAAEKKPAQDSMEKACEAAKKNVALLQSEGKAYYKDETGKQIELSGQARLDELNKSKVDVLQNCPAEKK